MSRRDKQADLRRRMAEARSKLVSSQSNANAHELDQANAAGKKRPLPPSSSGGGGGILRKPKYATSAAATATAGSSANESVPKKEDGALGALMAGYDDSSSDDEGGVPQKTKTASSAKSSIANQKQSALPPQTALRDNASVKFSVTTKKQKVRVKINDAESMHQPKGTEKVEATESPPDSGGSKNNIDEKPLKAEPGNGKSAEVSDEAWDEFNALLDDDDEDKAEEALPADSEPSKSEGTKTASVEEVPKKKSKKKKKKKEKLAPKDMYDNEAMNNVEQASYEARLGRLMLLKSKKAKHKTNDSEGGALLPSAEEFYDPGLSFQQDEGDDDGDGKESIDDGAKSKPGESGKDEEGMAAPSAGATVAPSISAPRVSLAKILRDRRDQARQLSSRGNDDDANEEKESDAANNISDGQWF